MSNLTDALIAAKLVGAQGGGSGGGSGLPEITTETEEILALQTLAFEEQGGVYGTTVAGTFDMAVGDTFTVSYDGDDYEVTVFEVADRGILGFGNLSLTEPGADTGEPFFGGIMEGNGLVIIASTSDPTHEVGISSTVYTPANGSILIVENGQWTTTPLEVVKTVTGKSGMPLTIPAASYVPVTVKNIPTLDHDYAAIRIAKTTEGATPLIVLDGTFKGGSATFMVYNQTANSVRFNQDDQVTITGIMM